jgi:menaquinone-specific isochorismate synthase
MAAPVALSGIAFQSSEDRSTAWRGYPDAVLTVPRFLFITNEASSWLAVSVAVEPNDDCDATVQSALDELSAMLTSMSRPATEQAKPAVTLAGEDDSAQWMQTVAVVEEDIRTGALEKLVLAREVSTHAENSFVWGSALRRLKDRYGASTTFAFARGDSCFMGSSPERLIRLDARTVKANCVAGSAPRGSSEEDDQSLGEALLHDDKELREHALVVDAYRDALQPSCVDLDIPDQPSLMAMPNVQHLQTPVDGTLRDDLHILDLVSRLHPTPAVGGVPHDTATPLIQKYEAFDRGWYAGPVGWFDSRGDGEFVVAIRSGLLREQNALLYAGCGIVEGSDPEREYEESLLKLEPMLWAMNGSDD